MSKIKRLHDELELLSKDLPRGKQRTMAEALAYGVITGRANYKLENLLFNAINRRQFIIDLASEWDGEDYISGAMSFANKKACTIEVIDLDDFLTT